ncbi:hypothetical protein P7H15_06745 [Paenibacillus larvae]|nr:binary toxin-like calcium binding domain-containing protein [Paenibacillus larvae]MDT2292672.1 hypothetical protein [Paenibacillus larvae]
MNHTAGDPYSDLEKASGAFDRTIHKQPGTTLVAAYPVLPVGMEELVLSNNKNISSTGKTVNESTSSSVSDSNTEGISTDVGILSLKLHKHPLWPLFPFINAYR